MYINNARAPAGTVNMDTTPSSESASLVGYYPAETNVVLQAWPKSGYVVDKWITEKYVNSAWVCTETNHTVLQTGGDQYQFTLGQAIESGSNGILVKVVYKGITMNVATMTSQQVAYKYGSVGIVQRSKITSFTPASGTTYTAKADFPDNGSDYPVLLAKAVSSYTFLGFSTSNNPAAALEIPVADCIKISSSTWPPAWGGVYNSALENYWAPDPSNPHWNLNIPVRVEAGKTWYARFDGDGTSTSTAHEIYSWNDWVRIQELNPVNADMLTASYDLYTDLANVTDPFGLRGRRGSSAPQTYTGAFNGRGHKISLNIAVTGEETHAGLFQVVGTGGKVQNLKLEGSVTASTYYPQAYAGAVAAKLESAVIENVVSVAQLVQAEVKGNLTFPGDKQSYAGGLVGYQKNSAIITSYVKYTTVEAKNVNFSESCCAGGISGRMDSTATIDKCVALNGKIDVIKGIAAESPPGNTGRIVGYKDGGYSGVTDNWASAVMNFDLAWYQANTPATIDKDNKNGGTTTQYGDQTWWTTAPPTGPGWGFGDSGDWSWNGVEPELK
jgi:hypothetical protein